MRVIHTVHNPLCAKRFVEPIVEHLRKNGFSVELWVEETTRYQSLFAALSPPVRVFTSSFSLNPLVLCLSIWRMFQALKAVRPEVIHTHISAGSTVPLLAAWLAKVPIRIYQCHGFAYLGYHGPIRWLLLLREYLHIWLATQVIAVSHSNLAEIKKDGLLKHRPGFCLAAGSAAGIDIKYRLTPDLRRTNGILFRQHLGILEHAFIVGYVGRPVKRKGFNDLLSAWNQSGLAGPEYHLVVAGCSRDDAEATGIPLPNNLHCLDFVDDLLPLYAAADVIALPSHHEGFGYALLEGAAAGAALLGSNIPGISCAIDDQTTGFLVPVGDRAALAERLNFLAHHRDLCASLGQAAQKRAFADFSREVVLEAALTFYRKLVEPQRL